MDAILQHWVLTLAVFIPAAGAMILMLSPKAAELWIKSVALVTSLLALAAGIYVLADFDYGRADKLQFSVSRTWIDVIHSNYHIGVDGISLPLFALSLFIVPLCIIYSWDHFPEPHNPKAFLTLVLILEIGMTGTFVAQDLILFFVFFELVLLPMYFMIGVWGGPNRQYASIKFFLFTLFGSALMILSFLALYFKAGETFDIPTLIHTAAHLPHGTQVLIFGGLFMGFAIKVPMFPFHTWLPDAHTEAPTVGSVILAAVLLKLGTYGFIRIAIPMLPDAAKTWAPWIGLLAVIGIIYGALGCLAQKDMKRLIAFSSVAHMGFVMLGISTLTSYGINAAVFGMVAHGLITGMLFFCAGSIQERFHTREIARLGGLLKQAPRLGWILGFCAFASLGLPGLAGFWGEFPAILSAYSPAAGLSVTAFRTFMVIASIGTVFAAGYLLWMYQRTAFGNPKSEFENEHIHDVHVPEYLAWIPMLVLIVGLGLFPSLVFNQTNKAVSNNIAAAFPDIADTVIAATTSLAAITTIKAPVLDYHALAPEIVLTGVLCLMLIVDLVVDETRKYLVGTVAGFGLLGSLIPIVTLALQGHHHHEMFGGAYVVDTFSLTLKALFILSGYVVTLISANYIEEGDYYEGEYSFLLVAAILGMVVMASARDLITIFVALELLSIPGYLLAGWRKRDAKSNEAMLKYYLLGVLSAGVMLYGMSLIFGFTGSTLLTDIGNATRGSLGSKPIVSLGIFFVLVGFAFKVSAVPFHFWAPDTYEGAPTPVTAFLSVASKAAGFAALLELVFIGFYGRHDVWAPLFWILAALTMTVGNLIALRQTNVVRMLAYSSVAQAGYMLVPFAAAGDNLNASRSALTAVVVYLLVYAAMNLGAFSVVIAVARKTRSGELSSFGGLFTYAPGITVVMTVFMFSLAGIPVFGGWFAKLLIFRAIADAGTPAAWVLGAVLAVNSVIALYYYANVAREMWMRPVPDDAEQPPTPLRIPVPMTLALGITVIITAVLGVYPNLVAHVGDLANLSHALGG